MCATSLPYFPHLNPMSPTEIKDAHAMSPQDTLPQVPSMPNLSYAHGYSHHGHAAAINDHTP